jgi:RNA polymerase sigma-70 factor (ECF subfamily)
MTEFELLDRYAQYRDAEAFALLAERYQRLVLSTCRRRLHHAADVDDAVQETFLRMARGAGSLRSNVGAWLQRCAANVSADLNRRAQTRTRHESQVVPAEPGNDTRNELAELREHLDAALEKLDPAERELIVQRFFVGRPQVELAGEAGVAPSTINHRLNTAIDHLRDHLKTAGYAVVAAALVNGLEREAASAAMSPALAAKVAGVGLTGVTAAAGGLSFTGFLAILLAVIAIFGVGLFWLLNTSQPAPVAVTATRPVAAPVGLTLTVDPGKTNATEPPHWLPGKPIPGLAGVLTGQVLDRNGKPVAGATVSLIGPDSTQTRTNAQGQYAFNRGHPDDGEYLVGVTADGFQSIDYWTDSNPKVAVSIATPGERNFVLDRGVAITVTVLNSQDEPMVNADVEAFAGDVHVENRPDRLTTDRDGICKATLRPSKTPYLIAATLDGYAPVHQQIVCDLEHFSSHCSEIPAVGHEITGVVAGDCCQRLADGQE